MRRDGGGKSGRSQPACSRNGGEGDGSEAQWPAAASRETHCEDSSTGRLRLFDLGRRDLAVVVPSASPSSSSSMSIAFRASVALDPVLWSVPGDGRGPTDAVCAEIRETAAAAAKLRRGVIEIPTTRGLNCLNPIYQDHPCGIFWNCAFFLWQERDIYSESR